VIARELNAKTKIDVFLIGKKHLVKEADFFEYPPAIKGGSSARTKHVLGNTEKVYISVRQSPLVGNAEKTKLVTSAIDRCPIGKKKYLRSGSAHVRIGVEGRNDLTQPPRIDLGVVIEEAYIG
jgi:hypothetical protein